jgi:hypothetical protein
MHWSRELLALTAGVRWRIAGLVAAQQITDPAEAVLAGGDA